jgi:hypothetical protein
VQIDDRVVAVAYDGLCTFEFGVRIPTAHADFAQGKLKATRLTFH